MKNLNSTRIFSLGPYLQCSHKRQFIPPSSTYDTGDTDYTDDTDDTDDTDYTDDKNDTDFLRNGIGRNRAG